MEEIYYPQMGRNPNVMTTTSSTTSNLYHVSHPQDDVFDFSKMNTTAVTSSPSPSFSRHSSALIQSPMSGSSDTELLQQLKQGFGKMISSMERLEQRMTRLEQTSGQILKNQQEVLQVPFMSQAEVDKARQVAEQLEQDTTVAKQLQAAYNKEIELKKSMTTTTSSYATRLAECPICGVRVNQMDLEVHVDQCLELFSNDPKKELQVQETKKKMETGFFGRLFKTTTKTETTKVVSSQPPTAPQRPDSSNPPPSMYPGYGYSPYNMNMNMNQQNGQNGMPMMMPMYMYPSYPPVTQLDQ